MKEEEVTERGRRRRRRFALLLACNDSEYVKKVYGGYLDVFVRAFGDDEGEGEGEGETWDVFRVVRGEFPSSTEEDLDSYDGFVLSGSPHDAYGDDDWILDLCFLLQTLHAMQKRVLGICFGHQVLCRALGGHVGKACTGWELGIRKMIIAEGLQQHCRFLQGFENVPSSASIIECHQDEVWELPIGAEVLAFSEKTAVEAFFIGEHILGIQGHPEYTKDILLDIIDRLTRNNSINCKFAEDAKANVEEGEPDRIFWEKLCKVFLKSTC